jgi:hypothetical protein
MVSPEQINERKTEDQPAPTPAVEQQVAAGGEKKRTWLKPLIRVGGIIVSLLGGFAIVSLTISNVDFQGVILVAFFLGGGCALLFRSWWAILVVPLAFALGEFLAWNLAPGVFSPDPRFFTDDVAFGVFFEAIGGALLATIGALIGAALVKKPWVQG